MKMSQVVKGEMSAKTTYQRSAKGPVSISECSADGKFITMENTGRKVRFLAMLTFVLWLTFMSKTILARTEGLEQLFEDFENKDFVSVFNNPKTSSFSPADDEKFFKKRNCV